MRSLGFIDCCVYSDWASQDEVAGYLPLAWQDYLIRPGSIGVPTSGRPIDLRSPYEAPFGPFRVGLGRHGEATTTDYRALVGGAIGDNESAIAILVPARGLKIPADNNPSLSAVLCRAVNDWTAERWLSGPDGRVYGSIIVSPQLPDDAAREIVRMASNRRMVQVVLSGNALAKPFGHPIFHPIYAAAEASGIPVAIHAGGDDVIDSLGHPTAGGLPSTYSELRALAAQPLMTHLVSLITQGVFETFPRLQVMLVGGGSAWIPAFLWRFENACRAFGWEAPWMTRSPTEYFRENVTVSTWPNLYATGTGSLSALLASVEGIEQILCYASGYPNEDSDRAEKVAGSLPREWLPHVFMGNARRVFGSRIEWNQTTSREITNDITTQ
jgi:predicted TIM-barrel fold metal-dependent hydrolase